MVGLLEPIYNPVRPEIMNPINRLAAGSAIYLGQTDEQKERERLARVEEARTKKFVSKLERMEPAFMEGLIAGKKPLDVNQRLRKLAHTDGYIYRYELILKEREEDARWRQARQERFNSILDITHSIKQNLIRAVFPRGGEGMAHLFGERELEDFRAKDQYEFKSNYNRYNDPERAKIKTLAEKFDAPKRIEIKELEQALKTLLEFKDIENSKLKHFVCRELAFVIRDLEQLYNLTNEGGPRIQMEFLGYASEADAKKVNAAKPPSGDYFTIGLKKPRLFPVSQDDPQKLKHEDDEYGDEEPMSD